MKWEYKCVIESDNYHLRKELNSLGAKGWEAYNVIKVDNPFDEIYIAYLKRPKRKKCHKTHHIRKMPAISLN